MELVFALFILAILFDISMTLRRLSRSLLDLLKKL
jgi:hypothetical protein